MLGNFLQQMTSADNFLLGALRVKELKVVYHLEETFKQCHYQLLCVFQPPYNTVTYSIIGDDSAPSQFTISPSSGMISYRIDGSVFQDSTANYRVGH